MLDSITFFLAMLGYAGLTVTAVFAARDRFPHRLWRTTALVIVAHVGLVWAVRYEWDVVVATRNGYAPFVIFHGALAVTVASIFTTERLAKRLVLLTFVIVSLGALGARFSEAIVARYRIPVVLLALVGGLELVRVALSQRHAT